MTGNLGGPATWNIYSGYTNRGRIDLLQANSQDTTVQVALLSNGNQRLTVAKDGTVEIKEKLGVGTSSPGEKIEVYADGADVALKIHEDAGTHQAKLHLRRGGSDWEIINDNDLIIEGEGDERLRIRVGTGNIGIGTSDPDSLLEISSDSVTDFLKLTSAGSGANPIKLIFEKGSSEQGVIEYNRNGDLEIYNTDNDGGVMIDGSDSAGADLYVNNSGDTILGGSLTGTTANFTTSSGDNLIVIQTDDQGGTTDAGIHFKHQRTTAGSYSNCKIYMEQFQFYIEGG